MKPVQVKQEAKRQIAVRLEATFERKLRDIADAEARTLNAQIRFVLLRWLAEHEQPKRATA
jgi:hypothetical protein